MDSIHQIIDNISIISIQKIFWIMIGMFFLIALISGVMRANHTKSIDSFSKEELENLASKAIELHKNH